MQLQGAESEIVDHLVRLDVDAAPIREAEKALLRFTRTITLHAYKATDEEVAGLRDHGWSDEQIAEAVYVTAMFAFFNRVADAFGIVSQGYGGPRLPPVIEAEK